MARRWVPARLAAGWLSLSLGLAVLAGGDPAAGGCRAEAAVVAAAGRRAGQWQGGEVLSVEAVCEASCARS